MRHFKITDRHPKLPWRRGKRYTAPELRWLSKRNGWTFNHHKKQIEIAKQDGRVIANFVELEEAVVPVRPDARLQAFAALHQ